jgi:hypothetical protein
MYHRRRPTTFARAARYGVRQFNHFAPYGRAAIGYAAGYGPALTAAGLGYGFARRAAGAQVGYYSGMGAYRKRVSHAAHRTGKRVYGSLFKGRGVPKQAGRRKPRAVKSASPVNPDKGSVEIVHSEYIDDFFSSATSGGFIINTFGINPGNVNMFPWLSGIALQFQKYRFKQLMLEYVPLVSESTSTTANTLLSMGSVVMAVEYDAAAPFYTAKAEMENSEGCVSSKPSTGSTMGIECAPQYNPLSTLYVSSNTGITSSGIVGGDVRLQNLGTFGIASFGVPTASSVPVDLGELWVSYRCCLNAPILSNGAAILSAHLYQNPFIGAPGTTAPFGGAITPLIQPSLQSGSSLQGVTVALDGTITFPASISAGQFMILYWCTGTSATINVAGIAAVANCSQTLSWTSNTTSLSNLLVNAPSNASNSTNVMCCTIIDIAAPGSSSAQVRVVTTVLPTSGRMDLFITQMNPNVV